ncbi:hypothetical protein SAMN05192533_11456 [Mesobacillus persicus]|uniref:Uncharacterized protein n=1 Tax=Mesobacillus persicus TaxID=930146 RepID=A0A1H8H1S4_9BACI|nr:hypothetical protein [Mesobacillus persicus]SEN50085.1 hypothetical protein SAMN05192533_11456 [Mesobacillus persicus]
MNRSPSEMDGLEKLLESLITMVGKTNAKVDALSMRVRQLELAAREPRVYSFIAEPNKSGELEQA